jgi:hypothetical protein
MALPANIKTYIKSQSHLGHQKHIGTVRSGIGHANRTMRAVTIKHADEPGPTESMAVNKVLALPK